MDRSSLLDQELPVSRHPGLKRLFRRQKTVMDVGALYFRYLLGIMERMKEEDWVAEGRGLYKPTATKHEHP